jgi:anti-sigma factor RsiW
VNCRDFVDFLMEYLDGTLPEGERCTFEQHMHDCPPCVTYLETYAETVRLGRTVCRDPEGPPPEDVPEQLVRAILAARKA